MREDRSQKPEVRMGRRKFLVSAVRYATAGGMLAGLGALVFRRGDPCVQVNACGNCGRFGGCQLPQAIEARNPLPVGFAPRTGAHSAPYAEALSREEAV